MSINKNNYEAFFLDYHEGNLSPQQVADLLLYVEQHPELKEEFESFENVTLDALSAITFEDKLSLKTEVLTPALSINGEGELPPISIQNKEEYFIKSAENTLTATEKTLLENFIKQHPQFLVDLQLFQKTIISADASITFENKEELKRTAITTDDLLISSIEGLLSKGETVLFNQQIAVDAEMQHNYNLYKQTILSADASIVYEDKEELKHKERKIVPFYYYASAIAAGILLLFGLFFLFNTKTNQDQNFADKKDTSTKTQESRQKENVLPANTNQENNLAVTNATTTSVKVIAKKQNGRVSKNDSVIVAPVIMNELPIANNIQTPAPIDNKEQPNNQQPITNNQTIASNQQAIKKNETPSQFLSLREIAAEKFKEKTLDSQTMAVQKQNGRAKRFTGWDLAQIVTRGISKVTGRDVEVKPTYNEAGDVTAYALGNGIEITRGR
ncbi:hypothetical protein BH10BAC1_BH10BAC1_12830 [soil metagenome]